MVTIPGSGQAKLVAGAGAAGGAASAAVNGLDKAADAAGDALRSIFGGTLPWNMSPGEIVDAVTGGGQAAPDGAATIVLPYATDLVGMVA